MTRAFDLKESDLKNILILPINQNYTGTFWRQDRDEFGLRITIQVDQDSPTKMILRKTKEAYTEQPAISARFFPEGNAPDIQQFLQPAVFECRPASPLQCYYVNNVRASHATEVIKAGHTHITAIVFPEKTPAIVEKINALVERSLEKYRDYVITY